MNRLENAREFFTVMAVVLACSLMIPASLPAQSDWLRKGTEILGQRDAAAPDPKAEETVLSEPEIGSGLKEALIVGTGRVVGQLGRTDGFNADPAIHIPLPAKLQSVESALRKAGMGSMMDDLELKLNRAAESATPKARDLFVQAVRDMTLEDVRGIYNGPDDAATRYFQGKMSEPLAEEMRPIVSDSLAEVGAIQSYNAALGQYKTLPFVPDVQTDLTGYVVEKGMDGIFHYVAVEEAAIRQNPAKRSTELLRKVFGNTP